MNNTLRMSKKIAVAAGVFLSIIASVFSLWLVSRFVPSLSPDAQPDIGTDVEAFGMAMYCALYWIVVLFAMIVGFLAMRSGPAYAQWSFLALTSTLSLADCIFAYLLSRWDVPKYFLLQFIVTFLCLSAAPAIGLLFGIRHFLAQRARAAIQSREKAG